MHKITLTLIATFFCFCQGFGQAADVWTAVETGGFGHPDNFDVIEFTEFKGYLYAGMGRTGPGQAQLWRSATGDPGDWTRVYYEPDTTIQHKGIPAMGHTDLGGGIMWIATGSPVSGGTVVYQTTDGVNWIPISRRGFGDPGAIVPTPNMVVFKGTSDSIPYLYAGSNSHGGSVAGKVWRCPYNNTDSMAWDLVVDFSAIDSTISQVTYFYIWNGTLYFGTNAAAQLWESTDGVNFTKNTGVGDGFGYPSMLALACFMEFHDSLYISTTNKVTGGHLYKTGDGQNWTAVTTNGFGKGPVAEELHNMEAAFDKLWITAYTDTSSISNGCPIWRSSDGTNFVQSNDDGFGNPDIAGENPVTINFGNFQYFGGPNYQNGGVIYRTEVITDVPESQMLSCPVEVWPNPAKDQVFISLDQQCGTLRSVELYDLNGKRVMIVDDVRENGLRIDKGELDAGMYFYRLRDKKGHVATGKIVFR